MLHKKRGFIQCKYTRYFV